MELRIRKTCPDDITKAGEWLKGWKLTPIEAGMYPETGLVLYDVETEADVYMGFVWLSNSSLAQIGFVTRNPFYKVKLPKNTRKEFLTELILYAKELGKDYVITWTENEGLIKDFKEIGLKESSNRCSELLEKI